MVQIAPSILAAKFDELEKEIIDLEEAGADMIHIDVMDGKFVEQTTEFLDPAVTMRIRACTSMILDAHLMVQNPEEHIQGFIDAGADIITIHVESDGDIMALLKKIKEAGVKPAICINPDTPVSDAFKFLEHCYMILVMSVYPGKCGQKFIEESVDRIKELKKYMQENNLDTLIQVDGGIKADNAHKVIEAGADIIVAGSGILGEKDYKEVMDKMRG